MSSPEDSSEPPTGPPPPNIDEAAASAAAALHGQGGNNEAMAKYFSTMTSIISNVVNSVAQVATALTSLEQRLSSTAGTSSSHLTNIFDGPIHLDTRAGRSDFHKLQELPSDWTGVDINLDNEEAIVRLFELKEKSYGFSNILHVPTTGTGAPNINPRRLLTGEDIYNADLGDHLSMIGDFPNLTSDHVLAWDAYIYGDVHAGLVKLPPNAPRVAKLLDRKAAGNLGLIANFKHEIRIRSQLLLLIIQQAFIPSSLQKFFVDKATLEWTDEVTGRTIVSGLVLLWRILESIMPNTVVDTDKLEALIEKTMLIPDANNSVRELFGVTNTALEKLRKKNGVGCYSDKRYITALFSALLTSTNDVFLRYIQQLKLTWTTDTSSLTPQKFMEDVIAISDTMIQEKKWDVAPSNDPQIIALHTQLTQLRNEMNKKSTSDDGTSHSGEQGLRRSGSRKTMADNILPQARLHKEGDFKTIDGRLYQWCDDHVARDKSFSGLYMSCNSSCGKFHDHEKWQQIKSKRYRSSEKAEDQQGNPSDTTPRGPEPKKLKAGTAMQHSFLTALTNAGHTHADSHQIYQTFLSGYQEATPPSKDD